MNSKQMHTGLKAYRLGDDGPSSVREKAFAEQWQQEQNHDLLAYLLGEANLKAEVSERDAQVAATIIQWLGTSVGQSFLQKVDGIVTRQLARSTN
jgi:hypothetical protein